MRGTSFKNQKYSEDVNIIWLGLCKSCNFYITNKSNGLWQPALYDYAVLTRSEDVSLFTAW